MTITKTAIQWTHLPGRGDGYSANPIRFRNRETGEQVTWACVKVSDGCKNCYAEALALRYGKGDAYTVPNMAKLEPVLDEKVIHEMLTSRKISGAAVFLGDMTDLFGEWVPDEMLDRIFAVMALRPDVIWQLLTKRPERMRAYLSEANRSERVEDQTFEMELALETWEWPLLNVWVGTSVEDQAAADARIPHLLATPAAVQFLSCEPLLGPVDLTRPCEDWGAEDNEWKRPLWGCVACGGSGYFEPRNAIVCAACRRSGVGISWVIFGGESGPRPRPCNVEWIRDGVRQCQAAGVAAYVKQLGGKPFTSNAGLPWADEHPVTWYRYRSRHGSDPEEWPEDLRVRQFPGNLTA